MKKKLMIVIALFASFFYSTAATAEKMVVVNFTTGTLTISDQDLGVILTTLVVLPKKDYYELPVTGRVRIAEMGPTWMPTPNMHLARPGKFKERYGPYEPNNAMGHCKLTIDFDRSDKILRYVRIHGNAEDKHLGGRHSAGCIRIPDSLCGLLVTSTENAIVELRY